MIHICKFFGWLEVNSNTPIEVKITILYNGVFSALLYGVESWGDVSVLEKKLISIELKCLKAILCIKKSTTNDLVYHELGRGDIMSKIKDMQ